MSEEIEYQINHSAAYSQEKPSIPVPAATVMLVRDHNEKIEVFMLKRAAKTNFGGAWVFPGGKLDADDDIIELTDICQGLNDVEASKKLNINSGGITYWVACIRECFEESGILLAYRSDGKLVNKTTKHETKILSETRTKLLKGDLVFLKMLKELNMKLATDQLAYISHWITPTIEKRRYNTRFFVAKSPNQLANHDGHEGVDSKWISAQEALKMGKAGTFPIIMPTIKSLEFILQFHSTKELLENNKSKKSNRIPKFEPQFIIEDGKPKLVRT